MRSSSTRSPQPISPASQVAETFTSGDGGVDVFGETDSEGAAEIARSRSGTVFSARPAERLAQFQALKKHFLLRIYSQSVSRMRAGSYSNAFPRHGRHRNESLKPRAIDSRI